MPQTVLNLLVLHNNNANNLPKVMRIDDNINDSNKNAIVANRLPPVPPSNIKNNIDSTLEKKSRNGNIYIYI